jgi:hypothetical protein
MNNLIWIISGLLVISKFLDCYTTSRRIKGVNHEQNLLVRKMMKCIGIQTTIWSIFVLSVSIVAISIWLLGYHGNSTFYNLSFIVLGSFIATIQFAVALSNHTGRMSIITRFLMKRYTK